MTRAVYRLDETGKRVHLGHVPDEYELRDGEHFYPLNDGEKDEQQRLLHKLWKSIDGQWRNFGAWIRFS